MIRGYQRTLEDRVLFPEGGGQVCAQRYQGTLEYRVLFPEGGGTGMFGFTISQRGPSTCYLAIFLRETA